MDQLLSALKPRLPAVRFASGDSFYWSARQRTVFYQVSDATPQAGWSLLHETGHALLDHRGFALDFELLDMELAAWQQAARLATELGVTIDDDYAQDCLDTYRSWLYRRSICPACETVGLQADSGQYGCFNCGNAWSVASTQHCRPYRRSLTA